MQISIIIWQRSIIFPNFYLNSFYAFWRLHRQTDRRTDGQTDRRTDGQTDGQTDKGGKWSGSLDVCARTRARACAHIFDHAYKNNMFPLYGGNIIAQPSAHTNAHPYATTNAHQSQVQSHIQTRIQTNTKRTSKHTSKRTSKHFICDLHTVFFKYSTQVFWIN